ncbi:MAG: hypothetical protein JWL84_595, partial [Rhodospirillales bacterium]|nr:hypothetical protein [Rhodospirillales bacterium]
SGLSVQTSALGKALAIVYGATRVPPNLIDYGDFVAIAHQSAPPSSGKGGAMGGGGKGGSGSITYTYQAYLAVAVGEGPIIGLGTVWQDKSVTTAAALNFSVFTGTYPQTPWGYLETNHPERALGYNGIAYAAAGPFDLGTNANLPNLNFEVFGRLYGTAPNGVDADPSQVVVDYLTNVDYSLGFPSARIGALATYSETLTVPSSGPYTLTVAHAAGFNQNLDVVDGSGNLLTCVAASPVAGQYAFAAGVYTFAAASASLSVTITYAAVGALTNYQNYTLASGLWISPAYSTQTQASADLDDIATYTNSEFVWSCGVLTLVPRGTVAITANGHTYTPPGAPLYDLTDDDYLPGTGGNTDDPIIVTRKRPADQINNIKVEFLDRANQYNTAIAEVSDQAMIDVFGRRSDNSRQAHLFCDSAAANTSAQLLLQQQAIRNDYQFSLGAWSVLIDPMDDLTLNDSYIGLAQHAVRVTEITENDDGSFTYITEDLPGGLGNAALYNTESGSRYAANWQADPGKVNAPVIFEPPDPLTATGLEVWVGISGSNPALYGGCDAWISTDGVTYRLLDRVPQPSRQGLLTGQLPNVPAATTGPTIDTTSTLAVDVSESDAELLSGTQADALALNTLCYVDGELIAYKTATLTSAEHYSLTYLVRGAYDSPIGVHAVGSQFLRLDGALLKIPFTQDRIGTTIHLKFLAYNVFGGGQESLSDVTDYTYVIKGSAIAGPLPNVTGLTNAYVAGMTQLVWDAVTDFRTVDYEIRFGATAASAQILGRTSNTNFVLQTGDGSYWVAAHANPAPGLDVYSTTWTEITIAGATLVRNVIATHDEKAEGWTGTTSGSLAVIGGGLELATGGSGNLLTDADLLNTPDILFYGGAAATGTYTSSHVIDKGRTVASFVTMSYVAQGQNIHADILGVPDFLGISDLLDAALSANINVQPQIGVSDDNVTWTWQNYQPGQYTARYIQVRLVIQSYDNQTQALVTAFSWSVDVPDRVDQYTNQTVTGGGLTITYRPLGASVDAPFKGGPGSATIPNVQITWSAQPNDTLVITSQSLSAITFQIQNGGVGVTRTGVHVTAQGF